MSSCCVPDSNSISQSYCHTLLIYDSDFKVVHAFLACLEKKCEDPQYGYYYSLITSLDFVVLLPQVISRIFYVVDRNWNGRITTSELRRSNFLQILTLLEDEPDINQVTDFFSYEHFYVIYCKFWELDTDHDLVIDAQDLSRHEGHGK